MDMKIIGISGKKENGKDCVADFISKHTKLSNCKIGFAWMLKREVAEACGITVDELEQHKSNFRLILQGWGTDFRRQLNGKDYWIKKMDEVVEQMNGIGVQLLIIPDVRFDNEYVFVREKGGTLVRVERPALVSTDAHISETELDHHLFDYTIRNDKSLFELEILAKQIIIK